jgi:hypothetical protein
MTAIMLFTLRERKRALKLARLKVGVVAQLVEHHNGIVGVRGSNPLGSTNLFFIQPLPAWPRCNGRSCKDWRMEKKNSHLAIGASV